MNVKVKCKCKISEHDNRVCTEHGVYGFIANPTDECGYCRLQGLSERIRFSPYQELEEMKKKVIN